MKKFLIILATAALFLGSAAGASAEGRGGVIGGMSFSNLNDDEMTRATMTNWHAGFVYRMSLPLGFSFEPGIMYNRKGAKTDMSDFDIKVGYVEIPLSIQWGPDLLVFRPFLDVTPYVGVAVNNKMYAPGIGTVNNSWSGLNRFEYGLGIGIGLDIWRFQVIGRYTWNFGSLAKDSTSSSVYGQLIQDALHDNNFRGFILSATILFGN